MIKKTFNKNFKIFTLISVFIILSFFYAIYTLKNKSIYDVIKTPNYKVVYIQISPSIQHANFNCDNYNIPVFLFLEKLKLLLPKYIEEKYQITSKFHLSVIQGDKFPLFLKLRFESVEKDLLITSINKILHPLLTQLNNSKSMCYTDLGLEYFYLTE